MADNRLFAKFDLDMPDHAKIAPLSDAAFRAFIESILWSRKHLTDGFLAGRYVVARWSLEVARELLESDDTNPLWIEVEGGYQIRDFEQHQDTKAAVEARREQAKAAGQKGGLARAKQTAKRPAKQKRSEHQAETETETELTSPNGEVVSPPKKASRIKPDWMPSQDVRDVLKAEYPNLDYRTEHANFVDYWLAKPGKGALKLDWDATWRIWMRKQGKEQAEKTSRGYRNQNQIMQDIRRDAQARTQSSQGNALNLIEGSQS